MSTSGLHRFATLFFAAACCAVVGANGVILLREHQAAGQVAEVREHIDAHSSAGLPDEDRQNADAALRKLDLDSHESARSLDSLRVAAPDALLAKTDERLRRLTGRLSSVTHRLVELSLIPDRSELQAAQPRILYAGYDVIDEFLEMAGPPNTLRNPATYTFTINYFGALFPEKKFGEVRRGQRVGDYKLAAVNVETRQGAIVKDKIVRHRRRKGGVREPVWSHRRLPSTQVVVVELSLLPGGSRHTLYYPASVRGEQGKVRREIPIGWMEIWESDEKCSSRFPVMRNSEFSWGGKTYQVEEVTPQELRLISPDSGEQTRWLRGGGP